MSIAEVARQRIQARPFLHSALQADVLNYTEAARFLDLEDVDAGAAALRRYQAELCAPEREIPDYRVRLMSGIGPCDSSGEALIRVGEVRFGPTEGEMSAVLAEGDIAMGHVATILARLDQEDVTVSAIGCEPGQLVIIVPRAAGHTAIRCIEETVPC